jgi:hypothetical protein
MANYLERIASSASRRVALAKPPNSGPPLVPARDLSLPGDGLLPSDDNQLFELTNQGGPERRESSQAEKHSDVTPTLNTRPGADAESTKLPGDFISRVDPVVNPAQDSLSSEAPFMVHLPKTLRPIADTRFQPSVESERRPGAPSHVPAGAGSTEFTVDKERIPVVQSSADSEVKESVRFAARRSAVGESNKILVPSTTYSAEPLPPAASPVRVPPLVVGSPGKQEQSRISIGSLEVMVNNHPPVAPASRTASTPLLNEKAHLERRYVDRFRLRH